MALVYCLEFKDAGICKIGHSKSLMSRITSLHPQFGQPTGDSPLLYGSEKLVKRIEQQLLASFPLAHLKPNEVKLRCLNNKLLHGATECFQLSAFDEICREMMVIKLKHSDADLRYSTLGSFLFEERMDLLSEVEYIKQKLTLAKKQISSIRPLSIGTPITRIGKGE
jgi:hypothetical protein